MYTQSITYDWFRGWGSAAFNFATLISLNLGRWQITLHLQPFREGYRRRSIPLETGRCGVKVVPTCCFVPSTRISRGRFLGVDDR